MSVRTRFAPSPTGYLHIGGARTALFSWLYARHHGGTFVLRIEDTDRERSTPESVQAILDGMAWLALDYDEGPVFQTGRFARYREVLEQMLDDGQAYHCYCSRERLEGLRAEQMRNKVKPRYDGHCRERSGPPPAGVEPVVRFRNPPDGDVVFRDLILGPVAVSNHELDDLVLARPDGTPTYNFTVVVDDYDMAISHVIRGNDHVNNTPRQVNILRALGAEPPRYAHVPMILGADGKRLSKRHGAVSVVQYREAGFLPEALLNYLVRLGWSHGDEEIFTRERMVELFELEGVNKAAAVFDEDKLRWLNQHYVKEADGARLAALLGEQLARRGLDPGAGPPPAATVEALRERAPTLADMAEGASYLYGEFEDYEPKAAQKHLKPEVRPVLEGLAAALAAVEPWSAEALHAAVEGVAGRLGLKLGKVAQPLRVAIAGRAATPPIDVTLELVGRSRTLARLERALGHLAGTAAG